jgi:hypothetical protein
LRQLFLTISALLLLAGCTSRTDEVLPVSSAIRGASFVREVRLIVRSQAQQEVAGLDEKAESRGAEAGAKALPFEQLLTRAIHDATREAGLTAGKPLLLLIELDSLRAPQPGAAFFGADDRLAGTVFVRSAEDNAELGQLYVNVGRSNGGVWSLVLRGGGAREQMARAFAERVALALGGRRPSR